MRRCHGNSGVFKSLWHVLEWACSQRFTLKPGRILGESDLEHTVYFSLHSQHLRFLSEREEAEALRLSTG